jgi:ABC-type amino acid transport system permease subunit
VWTLQVVAVVLGHVTGAWLGHSAVRRERQEGMEVSQRPLALLMVGLTVLTLWSLGQNLAFVGETVTVGS